MKLNINYLKYLSKAKGRHGTHSPFVYAFVENVLRKKIFYPSLSSVAKGGISVRKLALLLKTIDFLKPETIFVLGEIPDLRNAVYERFSCVKYCCIESIEEADLNAPALFLISLQQLRYGDSQFLKGLKGHQYLGICFIDIADSKVSARYWKSIVAWQNYPLTLDLWQIGLLLQDTSFKVKQHFVLK